VLGFSEMSGSPFSVLAGLGEHSPPRAHGGGLSERPSRPACQTGWVKPMASVDRFTSGYMYICFDSSDARIKVPEITI
jgi:hypothetical protein